MGFTKLDEDILKSSIMAADSDTFKVWITLLAACREDGVARLSTLYVSAICRIDIEKVEAAIGFLQSPDPHSRTAENEGRRIERIADGFLILNYQKYRARTYSASKEAERKRKYREKKTKCPGQTGHVPFCPDISASASASASASDKKKVKPGEYEDEFFNFWNAYDYKVAKADAFNAYKALRRSGVETKEIARALNGYHDFLKMKKEHDGFDQAKMYPATFLRKNKWRDYIGIVYKPKL